MTEVAILRAMIAMGRADHTFCESETKAIRRIYEEVTGEPLTSEELAAAIAERESGAYEAIPFLREKARDMSEQDKEKLIKAAYRVLLSDGTIAAQERKKLADIARAIDMPEIHYKAVLEDVSE